MSGPAPSTSRDVDGMTRERSSPNTVRRSAAVPPCTPSPGASIGPLMSVTSGPVAPTVAPMTTPTAPNGSAPALTWEISSMTCCATVRPSARPSCCTVAPSGFDVMASTNTPPPCVAAISITGCNDQKPRYGLAVIASTYIGLTGSRYALAYAAAVDPMSPRFTSSRTMAPASRNCRIVDSKVAIPREPNRSKKADCGLITAIRSANASTAICANRSSPSGLSGNPQRIKSSGCGSIPTHNGPRSSSARRSRTAKLSICHSSLDTGGPSVAGVPVVANQRGPINAGQSKRANRSGS